MIAYACAYHTFAVMAAQFVCVRTQMHYMSGESCLRELAICFPESRQSWQHAAFLSRTGDMLSKLVASCTVLSLAQEREISSSH
eukprot:6188418-Pleurochrysis_carterae.AAC.4